MSLFSWFSKKKKSEKIKLEKSRQNVLEKAAVAAAFAEAGEHEAARSMVEDTQESRKVLIVGRGDAFSEDLISYSLEMAKRLGFGIVALNVTDAPLSLPAERRQEASDLFLKQSEERAGKVKAQAEKMGIDFIHHMMIETEDEAIEKIYAEYPNMRYVLTEPDPEVAQRADGKVSIPVVDMGCYQGAAA